MQGNLRQIVQGLIEPSALWCGSAVHPGRAVMGDGRVFEKVYFVPVEYEPRAVALVEYIRGYGGGDAWIEAADVREVGTSAKRLPVRFRGPIEGKWSQVGIECHGESLTVVTALGTWQTWWLLEYADFYDFAWYVPPRLIVKAYVGRAKRVDQQLVDWKVCLI